MFAVKVLWQKRKQKIVALFIHKLFLSLTSYIEEGESKMQSFLITESECPLPQYPQTICVCVCAVRDAYDHKICIKNIALPIKPMCAILSVFFLLSFYFLPLLFLLLLFQNFLVHFYCYSCCVRYCCCDLSKCHLLINGHNLLNGFLPQQQPHMINCCNFCRPRPTIHTYISIHPSIFKS